MFETKDFPTKLSHVQQIPQESLLVTLDVKSLYTNIPNIESIKAVTEVFDKHPSKTTSYGMCNGHNLCSSIP